MPAHIEKYKMVQGHANLLPICMIGLVGTSRTVNLDVLVDTGATLSIFPKAAAVDADITLPNSPNYNLQFGSAGITKSYKVTSYLNMFGRRIQAEIAFVDFLPYRFALLGRLGIFTKFRDVAFCEKVSDPRITFTW